MDAYEGVLPQTQCHSHLVSLLGIKQAIVTTNKMHLVDHDRHVFTKIVADCRSLARASAFLNYTVYRIGQQANRHHNFITTLLYQYPRDNIHLQLAIG